MLRDFDIYPASKLTAATAAALFCVAGCTTPPEKSTLPAVPVQQAPLIITLPAPEPVVLKDLVAPVLTYADSVRPLQGQELTQEIARLNDASAPADQLKLAIALVQTRQLYDMVRAQELVQRVLSSTGNDARLLQPLARLLAARFAEQRRLEDQVERQGQQLRDTQRRLDQTNERLEALKEIERSLTRRSGSAASPQTLQRNNARPAAAKP